MLAENYSTKPNFLSKKPFKIYDGTYDFRKKSKFGQRNRGKVKRVLLSKIIGQPDKPSTIFHQNPGPKGQVSFLIGIHSVQS